MEHIINSKLLITSGAGFIGSNLVEHFLKKNNEVVCLDNVSTGHKKNILPFFESKNFQFIVGDIPHSHAAINKAKAVLDYYPNYNAHHGFEQACKWYWENM